MIETFGALLMHSKNTLNLKQGISDKASILGIPINTLGGDRIEVQNNIYDLTTELYKTRSSTSYTGKTMKNENDILMMNNIIRDLVYTGVGDKKSNRKIFLTTTLPELVEEIQNKTFEEIIDSSDDLQGEGVKIIIPSNIIDIYARLEVLVGLKLSSHTDTLTKASNLMDELYKRGEIQNKQQNRNALDNFSTL